MTDWFWYFQPSQDVEHIIHRVVDHTKEPTLSNHTTSDFASFVINKMGKDSKFQLKIRLIYTTVTVPELNVIALALPDKQLSKDLLPICILKVVGPASLSGY